MKGLAAAALAVAIAFPVCAQRGVGGHASFGGHGANVARSAPTFHGSFAPSAPLRYTGVPLAHAPISYPSSMRILTPGVRYPVTAPINRPSFYHPGYGNRNHNFFIRTYPVFPYAYSSYVYGYFPPDLLDDSFDNYDSSQQLQAESTPDYGSAYPQPMPQPEYGYPQPMPQPEYGYPVPAPPPEYGYAYPQPMPAYPAYPAYPESAPQPAPEGAYAYPAPPVPPGYQPYPPQQIPQPAPAAPQMQYVPGSASTVILIYKDGRPPEQIQNYLATRSTLTILDGGRRREIPLSELNIPATMSANHQTGVDFQLPSATQ